MAGQKAQEQIEEFIHSRVIGRGLDERTVKAYRMDLEHFYLWMDPKADEQRYPERMEAYLKYLSEVKGLRSSTVNRKQRVFRYYLSYLISQGVVTDNVDDNVADNMADGKIPNQWQCGYLCEPLKMVIQPEKSAANSYLSKKEIDRFFQAIDQEYSQLDSDFRKRVCLRDQVMMKLLFYHGIEVSELLRLEVLDYDRKTGILTVRRKREKKYSAYVFSKELRDQMLQWLGEHECFEREISYHNRMFLSKYGKPLSMKMVINIFEKYRVMAGIEKECTPKDLKNGFGRYAEEVVRERC